MKKIYPIMTIAWLVLLWCLASCTNHNNTITNRADYQQYMDADSSDNLQLNLTNLHFWKAKLSAVPNQVTYMRKVAGANSQLFDATGNITYLKTADSLLLKANDMLDYNDSGLLRSLARNYISQHRFREALALLQKAEKRGDNRKATEKMLFDVYLELGNDQLAAAYLDKIKVKDDFDYKIRWSKWNDHTGNLTEAIHILEQTLPFVASSNAGLKLWTYSNLADYYGHAGLINKSYAYYLKALAIDPGYTYALRGIAWIAFSHEKNVNEASAILDNVSQRYQSPDLYLTKAEIASFAKKEGAAAAHIATYFEKLDRNDYGVMYDKYNVLLLAESKKNTTKAITIAKNEIKNRPTTQSYDLLAWAYFHHGDYDSAVAIIDDHVFGKTSEPEVLYHIASIYKAKGKTKEVSMLKEELLASTYELGPHMIPVIQSL